MQLRKKKGEGESDEQSDGRASETACEIEHEMITKRSLPLFPAAIHV